LESIYSSLISDDFFIGFNDTMSGLLGIIENVIQSMGGLKGVLAAVGGLAT